MDKRLNNRFNMYKVVRDWCLTNSDKLSFLPDFATSLDEFVAVLVMIADLDVVKTGGISNTSTQKNAARDTLERQVMEAIRILKAYAIFSPNGINADDLEMTPTDLSRMAEQALLSRSKKVIQLAVNYQEAAAPYGLVPERLAALQQAHDDFNSKQTAVRNAIVSRKDAGEQLEARMDEADDLLKGKLDVLMEVAAITLPELHNQYKGARVIVDR